MESMSMSMMTPGKFYVTGGTAARDHAYLACHDGYGDRGAWKDLLLSGPIDAPDAIPAGACASGPYRDGENNLVPSILYTRR